MPVHTLMLLIGAVIAAAGLTVLLFWMLPGPGGLAVLAGAALLARLALMLWRR